MIRTMVKIETRGRKRIGWIPVEDEYLPIDRYVIINDGDPNLFPIKVDQLWLIQRTYKEFGLPPPKEFPTYDVVDGYGLRASEQMFKKEVIPSNIIQLEKEIKASISKDLSPLRKENTIINEFWQRLEDNQDKYAEIIDFLRRMWYYRLFGKFIFINGKVTYITGEYWYYLNFWTLKGNVIPEYRSRDRRWFVGTKFGELDTTTFKCVDHNGIPVKNEDGEYDMIDLGYRICYGANISKHRQAGDTSKVQASHTEYVTRMIAKHSSIQGKDDENAENVFREHCVYPYSKLPIWFKPLRDSSEKLSPKSSMLFDTDELEIGLHSRITFAKSADAIKYDNEKIDRYHADEPGKTKTNVVERHNVIKPTMARGAGRKIDGSCKYVTTVELMTDYEASNTYMKLCYDSMYEERLPSGQTKSGMYTVFFKASDGLEGFIDMYGDSIIKEPTPEQMKFTGNKIGAETFIKKTIDELKRKKDWVELASFKRKHPLIFRDNFSIALQNMFFNKDILETRLNYLSFDARQYLPKRGNLVWESMVGSRVIWVDDPDTGRFYKSIELSPEQTNNRYFRNGIFYPMNPYKFIASCDTFSMDKPSGRASMGGGCVKYMLDKTVDKMDKEVDEWISDRPVMTYCFRPDSVEEFCLDMIRMMQYFNAKMYPERNVRNFVETVKRLGYEGYLLYDYDSRGKMKSEAGWYNQEGTVLTAFNLLKDDIQRSGKRWTDTNLISECLSIPDPQHLTDFDLLASYLGCLLGEQNAFYNVMKMASKKIDTSKFIPMRNYNN